MEVVLVVSRLVCMIAPMGWPAAAAAVVRATGCEALMAVAVDVLRVTLAGCTIRLAGWAAAVVAVTTWTR